MSLKTPFQRVFSEGKRTRNWQYSLCFGPHKERSDVKLWKRLCCGFALNFRMKMEAARPSETFVSYRITLPWRWKQQVPPKHWYPTTSLHSVTAQKTAAWIFIAMKTLSLAKQNRIFQWQSGFLALKVHASQFWAQQSDTLIVSVDLLRTFSHLSEQYGLVKVGVAQ
jgi:hypothetical protein